MCSAGLTFSLNEDPCGFLRACLYHWSQSVTVVKEEYERSYSYKIQEFWICILENYH
jgi:hypothetical protein